MNRTVRPWPPTALSRDSYMSTASGMTDSSISTVMTDIWDHNSPQTSARLGSPNKARWRTSQIGSNRNYGYGNSANMGSGPRPFYKRASTNITIPDASPEKKPTSILLEEVDEASEAEEMGAEVEKEDVPEADEDEVITFGGPEVSLETGSKGSMRKPLFGAATSWTTGYPTSPSIRNGSLRRPESGLFFDPTGTETSSPLPDRLSLHDSPKPGSRTKHIAATLEALEAKSGSGSDDVPTTPTRNRVSKRVSSKIQSINQNHIDDREKTPQGSISGMKASPSIMALRNTGGIRNRISMIENNTDELPPTDAFRITSTPRQVRSIEASIGSDRAGSPVQSMRSPSVRSSRIRERPFSRQTTLTEKSRTEVSSFAGFLDDDRSTDSGTVLQHDSSRTEPTDLQSPVETYESFAIDSYYGEGSRGNADIGDLAERVGDVRVGTLVTTSSGNLIHLPNVSPLNIRRPLSSTTGDRWAGEREKNRLQALRDMDIMTPELSEEGTRTTDHGGFTLLTPTLSDMRKENNLPLTPPKDGETKTVSPRHFSTSKPLPKRTRVPPPELTPKTAAASVFRAPSTKTIRTAAWIRESSESENIEHADTELPETMGRAQAMIDRFEAKTDLENQSGVSAKSLPATPIKRSARQIGLGTPPARGPQTESRIGSGRAGIRGELSGTYVNNRDKPLPAIYPYANQQDRGLKPPERTWTSEEVVIPVSPPRAGGKSSSPWNAGSPLKGSHPKSKSPLKDFMGKLSNVRNKVKSEVGRRRAGTLERSGKTPPWSVPAYRAGGGTDPVDDVFGNISPLPQFREKEAENGLGQNVGVAHSVLSSSVAPSQAAPVMRDRMGDAEMQDEAPVQELSQPVLRQSTGFCLLPPPCSTTETIGLWAPVELQLTADTLRLTPSTGNNPLYLGVRDCSDIRSLSPGTAAEQGIPPVYTENGIPGEILELTLAQDGSRKYIALEGLSSRLGWVSALWDAALGSQRIEPSAVASDARTQGHSNSVFYTPFSMGLPSSGPLVIRNRDATPNSISTVRMASGNTPRPSPRMGSALRNSVQDMFQTPVDGETLADRAAPMGEASKEGSGFHLPQSPVPAERELSLFSRTRSLARAKSTASFVSGTALGGFDLSDETLGFDESDLNPSRSASQCARPTSTASEIAPEPRRQAYPIMRPRGPPGRPLPQPKMPSLLGPRAPPAPATFRVNVGPKSTVSSQDDFQNVPAPLDEIEKEKSILDAPLPLPTETTQDAETTESPVDCPDEPEQVQGTESPSPGEADIPSPSFIQAKVEEVVALMADADAQAQPEATPEEEAASDDLRGQLKTAFEEGAAAVDLEARPHSASQEDAALPADMDLQAQLETVRAEARLAFSQSKLLQEQTDAIRTQADAVRALSPLVTKMDTVHLDIKEIQNSLQIAALGALKQAEAPPIDLEAVHSKLDALASALSAQTVTEAAVPAAKEPAAESEEAPKVPPEATDDAAVPISKVDEELTKSITTVTEGQAVLADQVKEVLSLVQGIQTAREAQTQQSADMAKYLGQLNGWLEQFVIGSTKEMQNVAGRLDRLVKELAPEPAPAAAEGEPPAPAKPSVTSLVNQVHDLMLEQKQRTDEDASTAQRVDNLLNTMVEDRNTWTSSLDSVRQENEQLLRAMATDLTSEIRGERLRFVEAMREATSVNVSLHIEEFKNMLNTEVSRNMQELTQMREQKRTLELQLSDYFALMAKTNKGSDGAGLTLPGTTPGVRGPLPLPPTSPHQ